MIDIESQVYTPIAEKMREIGVDVSGVYKNKPPKLPHVSIVESDNRSDDNMDSGDSERFSVVMYEVNVYSNHATQSKSECKRIMSIVSNMMYKRNFRRLSCVPVPNMEDASIYRMTARFRAKTDGQYIYRR